MHPTRRHFTFGTLAAFGVAALGFAPAHAAGWQKDYPTLTLGVITSENEADRIVRYKPVRDYFEKRLGVEIKWRSATDYAGIIEGVKAKHIEIARFGPAAYAQAHIVTNGQVEPIAGEYDNNGDFGYYSVVIVKQDSPFKTIQDLKGKRFAFADPNSASGYAAPSYFLGEEGIEPNAFFGSTTFSGSHENSVMGLLSGNFDGVATWYNNEVRSNPARMEGKGMIPPGQWRVVWTSPLLPSSPWAMATWLPEAMRADVKAAIMGMKDDAPAAWQALTDGKSAGLKEVSHDDYEPMVRMVKANQKSRRGS